MKEKEIKDLIVFYIENKELLNDYEWSLNNQHCMSREYLEKAGRAYRIWNQSKKSNK